MSGCETRPACTKENVLARHVIFRLARKKLIIVDRFTTDYSSELPSKCYGEVKWGGLFSEGSVSKMRVRTRDVLTSHILNQYLIMYWYHAPIGYISVGCVILSSCCWSSRVRYFLH